MSRTLPALAASTFDPADLESAVTGYARTLTAAVRVDAAARRDAGTTPEDMAVHLTEVADLLDRIGAAFREAAAEARAATEIDKARAGIGDTESWRVPLPDGSAIVIGPDKVRTTTWDERMLSAALAEHAMLRLQADAVAAFEVPPSGEERDRLKAAVEAGMATLAAMGKISWRVTDLARVRQDLANADAAEATLIDRARTVSESVRDSVKVTRVPAKPVKP